MRPTPLLAAAALGLHALAGCSTHSLPPPGEAHEAAPPPPPPVRVPAGCEERQAGDYHHADNPAFRYQGADDGGTLVLELMRARPDGGLEGGGTDTGAVVIRLERTPEGFRGHTHAVGFTVAGRACPVAFPTDVTACRPEGLTLRAAATLAIDENCQPPAHGPRIPQLEQVLRRGLPPPEPDAGS